MKLALNWLSEMPNSSVDTVVYNPVEAKKRFHFANSLDTGRYKHEVIIQLKWSHHEVIIQVHTHQGHVMTTNHNKAQQEKSARNSTAVKGSYFAVWSTVAFATNGTFEHFWALTQSKKGE